MRMRNGTALLDVVVGFLVVGVGLVPALTLISSNAASVRPRASHAMVAALAADVLDRLAAPGLRDGPSSSLPPGGVLSPDALRAAAVDAMGAVPDALERDIASGALALSIERRDLSGAEDGAGPASERLAAWIVTVRWKDRSSRRLFRVSRVSR